MSEIVILSGSPSANSGSERVLTYLGTLLEYEGFSVAHVSVKDVPYQDLFEGNFNSATVQNITTLIQNSKGVLIGSPVYKSAYSGVLKALIDLLPEDVLKHKPILPFMTGGSPSHLLAIDYSLKPLLASLKGLNLKGIYVMDSQIDKQSKNPIINKDVLQRTKKQLYYFSQLVHNQGTAVPIY